MDEQVVSFKEGDAILENVFGFTKPDKPIEFIDSGKMQLDKIVHNAVMHALLQDL